MTTNAHNWQLIREFYAMFNEKIMAQKPNEWGIDPYAWDTGLIRMTPIESWLWHDIRALDVVAYPQYPVGKYFVDFANPKAKVAIECDGEAYHRDKSKDADRDKKLREAGWSVYRISGKDCRDGVDLENQSQSKAREFVFRVADRHDLFRDGDWARARHMQATQETSEQYE